MHIHGRLRHGLTAALFIALALVQPEVAMAQSLESLVNVQGIRDNQLVGYSLVVGLNGTGDKNQVKFTNQTITNMLRQFGVQLPSKIDPKVKNVAAVAVSANLPPMYARGQTIDVTVSSIGDAKSLRGGTLLLTQLHGADGEVYALAQGSVVVGGVSAAGHDGSSVTVNTPTAGLIPNGATVEREIPSDFNMNGVITLNLKRPSFKDANNIAIAVNRAFGGGIATAKSSTSVAVTAPADPGERVAFMSRLDDVQIQAERVRARVVFNSRTGTVVMGDGVVLHAAAVSHGNLTVSITESRNVSQPNALAGGRTVTTPQSDINVDSARPRVISLPESSSLKTLVSVLNGLGASPDDIMSILQALHEAGALDADLEVI
ncbi:flagellar P-ring protein [Leminorella grimontii]|uniref:Flagellar P-ring protein n=1 Tax=Leminorella grimontii TaxID=82981 RepID=A0AAV5N2K3_9GAMM|nr:flagellar basal body P-ring protein FlgI [Leminorella grimontii]KFC93562.1 FlgI family flagellar P-ring protein [Leminorella grimontii ATCC 33999 = DSM 5078]GKX55743.1 flagellar P-ring protein [Leminorella grimontii]GKX59553.1 flagellar P-ring protein [Leminorella grimontii]